MIDNLKVLASVSISEGCPISYTVHGSDAVTFLCGPSGDGFEFDIDAEALRDYVTRGSAALAEMDALADQEDS